MSTPARLSYDEVLKRLNVLPAARDSSGTSPHDWLSAALAGADGPIAELGGAGPDGSHVLVRVNSSAVLTTADALPLATNSVEGVLLTLCLQAVTPMAGLFSELRRVLRPAGTLAALLPARPGLSPAELRGWRPLRRALGQGFHPRHAAARDHPAWLFASADFALLTEQRRLFRAPLPDAPAAGTLLTELARTGMFAPGLSAEAFAGARAELTRRAGPGQHLPIPLRLLVARR